MSTPQWQNLPAQPGPSQPDWSGFTADPRSQPQLRASDDDRSRAGSLLGTAFAQGRLSKDEYDQRLNQAMAARQLGELVPVLDDLVVAPAPSRTSTPVAHSPRGFLGRLPMGWLGLAALFNAIWLMTCLTSGRLLYYWPMWPMFGTAVPMLIGFFAASGARQRRSTQRRQLPPEQDLR